jgi:hypothetical protein
MKVTHYDGFIDPEEEITPPPKRTQPNRKAKQVKFEEINLIACFDVEPAKFEDITLPPVSYVPTLIEEDCWTFQPEPMC